MADPKVLTAAKVAKELELGIKICRQLFGFMSDDHNFPIRVGLGEALADRLESLEKNSKALRADNTRLTRLIEGMGHISSCAWELSKGCVSDCAGCIHRASDFRFGDPPPHRKRKRKECDCIQSKVKV